MSDTVFLEDPDEILDYLGPVIRVVDEALDSGISEADDFFSVKGRNMDTCVWSTLVRYGACRRLDRSERDGWERVKLPFCGLQVVREPLTLRVLKAQNGEVPTPGKSARRQGFYMQLGPTLPLDFGGAVMPPVSNLLFDWQVNKQRERTYHLSKPAGLWEYWEEAVLEWRCVVEVKNDVMRFVGDEETGRLVDSVIDLEEVDSGGAAE
jgi:hypothetical protein